jgi:hypothetical protein
VWGEIMPIKQINSSLAQGHTLQLMQQMAHCVETDGTQQQRIFDRVSYLRELDRCVQLDQACP